MKKVVILGSTGSIGTQSLDIIRRLPQKLRVVGLAANGNATLLAEQANQFGVKHVCIGEGRMKDLRLAGVGDATCYEGLTGMCELVTRTEVDLVVMAVAGATVAIGALRERPHAPDTEPA